MAGRRAITEAQMLDDSDEAIDLNNMNEEDLAAAMAQAYANGELDDDEDYGQEEEQE